MKQKYYWIDEAAAKRAKEMSSYSSYQEGSATEAYQKSVDRAIQIGEEQKAQVDACFHEKIDYLVDMYARKLAGNLNEGYRIQGKVPSVLIAGGAGVQRGKKEKQMEAARKNNQSWQEIQGILDKIRSTGKGGISADRENALALLEEKLKAREARQEQMKEVNAFYRKHQTLEGCEALTEAQIHERIQFMEDMRQKNPYSTYTLANNSAEIRRLRKRIGEIRQDREAGFSGWEFAGGRAVANKEYNRLQLIFDEKPSLEQRGILRRAGFHWANSAGAWQRQLNWNAIRAAQRLGFVRPLNGESPLDLQPGRQKEKVRESITR